MQALTLWLQYLTLIGQINIPSPNTLRWVFSTASFAFATITSGSLSTDCLLSPGPTNLAFQRLLLQLAVPLIILIVLSGIQFLVWYAHHFLFTAKLCVNNIAMSQLALSHSLLWNQASEHSLSCISTWHSSRVASFGLLKLLLAYQCLRISNRVHLVTGT